MIRVTFTFVIALALLFTSAPKTTHAQVFVDPVNLVQNTIQAVNSGWDMIKEGGLDAIAWTVAKSAIQSVTKSTVDWINSGFDGSPAYVTDLNRNLLQVGDRVADDFFEELQVRNEIDSPFRDDIVRAIRDDYYRSTGTGSFFNQNRYTLNEVSDNPEAFLAGDFSQGGWDAWIEMWRNPQNNPFGAREQAEQELGGRISGAQGERRTELEWGRGFLSWRGDCATPSSGPEDTVDLSSAESDCVGSGEIQTPGAVIESQLEQTLGSQLDQLGLADEFNEVIGALLAQLTSNVLGGSGLGGLSALGSGGGSFIDRATRPDQTGAASASATFSQTIRNQRGQIATYKSNWQKIQGAAQSAAACGNDAEVQAVLSEAAAAIARADESMTGLDTLSTRLQEANSAAGGNQIAALEQVSTQYQQLMANTLPTPSDLARAQSESQSGNGADTLYTRMQAKAKLCGRT